jgi:glycosyltransferase involved in cell wall biosynthesis
MHHRFVAIPNGYDPELCIRIEEIRRVQHRAPANGCMRLCHPGTIYGHRKLQPIVSAIKMLVESGQSVSLEQVGTVVPETNLMNYLREHRLEQFVQFFGQQPYEVALQRMAAADAFVLIQPGTSVQVPGKLFEMLLFRKPIVALTNGGETADIIKKYRLGVVADPNDHHAIARAVRHVAQDFEEKRHDSAWQAALDAFDGRRLTRRLAACLDDVCSRQLSQKSEIGL